MTNGMRRSVMRMRGEPRRGESVRTQLMKKLLVFTRGATKLYTLSLETIHEYNYYFPLLQSSRNWLADVEFKKSKDIVIARDQR